MIFRGMHTASTPIERQPGESLLTQNARLSIAGEFRRRRGMARSSIIKKDGSVTGLRGFSAYQSNVFAALTDGDRMQGYQNPYALWGDNPDPFSADAIVYTPIASRADNLYNAVISNDGAIKVYNWNTGVSGRYKYYMWHRASSTWLALSYESPSVKLYNSANSDFPGVCPGTGWTLLNNFGQGDISYGGADSYLYYNVGCDLPDGGTAILTCIGSPLKNTIIFVGSDLSVSSTNITSAMPAAYSSFPLKLFCPRGGDRLFVTASESSSGLGCMYADPPYTSWTLSSLTLSPYYQGWGGMYRVDSDVIIAFRPWMYYYYPSLGSTSSQAEIWRSTDNGASWAFLSAPWGAPSTDNRNGTDPIKTANGWRFTNYGDPQNPTFVYTEDWATFTTQTIAGESRSLPYFAYDVAGGIYAPGNVPAGGFNSYSGIVRMVESDDGFISYDDSFAQVPSGALSYPWQRIAVRETRAWEYEL